MAAISKRIVVLISGTGRNLQALIEQTADTSFGGKIVAVISNRPQAYGLERAKQANIATNCVDHTQYATRENFDSALAQCIDHYQPDLIILAGFMRILTDGFVNRYLGKMLNIHPSLLPKYPGINTHQRALDAGDNEHGVTVHFVTPELDSGPLVIQGKLAISAADTAEGLAEKVMGIETQIYPLAAQWFCQQRLSYQGNIALLDGEPLHAPYQYPTPT